MGELDGKVIAVTGAGRGIGLSHAQLLASEGARVVVNDLGTTPDGRSAAAAAAGAIRASGGTAVADDSDISTWSGGESLVEKALSSFGALDGLVLNAGIIRDRMLVNMVEDEWDAVMAVHLKGHFAPLRAASAHWRQLAKETGRPAGAHVVMTSSEAGLYGNVGQANYSAAKAGIVGLAMVAARELERYGISVNAICPRSRTPMTEHLGLFDAGEGFDRWDPDNIAPFVGYLCSDASSEITGRTFVVHGGTVSLLEPWQEVAHLDRDSRWTVAELIPAAAELFRDRSPALAPFPDPTAAHA
ncbi:SDR family NAD(P)-dependent oxidoreductase [Nakamurella sp. YIM 132087]|uniref:SDR family NAD(P)-dependent oxidoreductase n=1 Tax=Nakamurella alba TaxID=2665158 RepID=A0A7K1FG27_9ACTN|nr:SDR family NAD(P)-dependent oxidoreductase [Nakamurella alba]MTD12429.1 SDR family NAD(P)-dependent oxidoreductase [Nakamurella alba]